jgi:hypothetical protein
MTTPSTARKAGPFLGTGSQTAWPFTFKVFAASDVAVTIANSEGVETALELDTDYSVSLNANQESSPGGTVTYPISGSALPVGGKLSITGDIDYDQGYDIPSGGNFSPVALENQLDRTVMQIQQLKEEVDRAAKLPVTNDGDAESLVQDLVRLADSADNIDTLVANLADITTVADDLNEPVSEINTVAGAITNVNAVGTNIANVNTVAGISANVTSVAGNATNINTVAGISTSVTTVAGISANVTSVAGNATNINTVAGDIASVQSAATNMAAILAAPTQASNAAASASAAATSATNAATSASAAATSATNAANSATGAGAAQSGAGASATAAFNSATAAATSATNASTSAATATTKASEASASASAAATSASAALESANNASRVDAALTQVNNGVKQRFVAGVGYTKNTTTQLTLTSTPAKPGFVQVFFDGVYQNSDKFTLAGAVITFTSAIPADTVEVAYDVPVTLTEDAYWRLADARLREAFRKEKATPIAPTLLLDFSGDEQLDPRVTFTRASTATYYDGKTVALAEQNLLAFSQNIASGVGPWASTGAGTTLTPNNAVAPNSTTTATTVSTTGAGGIRCFFTTPAGTYTVSCWVRSVSGNTSFQTDFQNGNIGARTLTSGWERHVSTETLTASKEWIDFQINGAGVFEIWGAQLEQRSSVTAYTPTTTQPITNYVPVLLTAAAGVPRFEHNPVTGESLGLLIEEQRTNLLTYSEQFDNASWVKSGATVTANNAVAPDGTLSADKIVPSTNTETHWINVTFTATTSQCTGSIYVKPDGSTVNKITLYPGGGGTFANFNLGTLTSAGETNVSSTSITAVGNGWYRLTATWVAGVSVDRLRVYASSGSIGGANNPGDGFSGIYIWGAQLEVGAFPTRYIPTVASQVTRSADAASMTGTNFSSWYRADEGTLFADLKSDYATGGNYYYSISDGTSTNYIYGFNAASGSFIVRPLFVGVSGSAQVALAAASTVGAHKLAAAYKTDDFAASVDGATALTDTSGILPVVNRLNIGMSSTGFSGQLNGTIKKIAFYPLRLTNAQLQALTS